MEVAGAKQDQQKLHENRLPAQPSKRAGYGIGWRRHLAGVLGLALAGWLLPAHAQSEATGYTLGQGYRLGDSGFTLGGYSTVSLDKLHGDKTRAALDDLSLFVWWEGEGRWKLFAELDYENVLAHPSRDHEGEGRYLALERLYADYALSDRLSLRLGKFLTPIGRWNQIHATPLVWTSSRPLITEETFPTNVTGLMATGTLDAIGDGIEYAVYGSKGEEIRANPAIDPFSEVLGAHVSLPLSVDSRLGLSYATFEQESRRDERKQLLGLDFVWSQGGYELSAEGVYRRSDEGSDQDEKGAFVQFVMPLTSRLFAVGRAEAFRQAGADATTRLWVGGLNYRLDPAVVLKAEWIGAAKNRIDAPHGLMTSISVLF